MAQAVWNEAVIAESDDVAVVDGYTYFPRGAVRMQHLERSDHHTVCGWKGQASYYHVVAGGKVEHNAAFEYPEPSQAAVDAGCGGRIAFWKGVKIRSRVAQAKSDRLVAGDAEIAKSGLRRPP